MTQLPKVGDYIKLTHDVDKLGCPLYLGLVCEVKEHCPDEGHAAYILIPLYDPHDRIIRTFDDIDWDFRFEGDVWEFEYLTPIEVRNLLLAHELQR